MGGGIGLLLGLPGVGSAAAPAASKSAAQAGADEAAAYARMKPVGFHPNDINAAYHDAWNDLTPAQINDLSPVFKAPGSVVGDQLRTTRQAGGASADTLNGYVRNLRDRATTSADGVLANKISDNLDDMFANTAPITNHPVGLASDLQTAAKTASGQARNAEMLEEARRVGGLPGGGGVGQTIPDAAQSALKNNPQFYTGDADAAMRSLAGAGGWVPGGYMMKHAIAYPLAGAVAGGVHGYATGGSDPWTRAAEEAGTGLVGGFAAGKVAPMIKSGLVKRALSTAGPTLTAGAPYNPPQAPVNQLLQAILHSRGGYSPLAVYGRPSDSGVGASGAFVPQ